jgi:hypothetical protein
VWPGEGQPCRAPRQRRSGADAWHAWTGAWPRKHDGPIPGAGLKWLTIDNALNAGARSLPGKDTLARLLARERGVAAAYRPSGDLGKVRLAQRLRAKGWTLAAIGQRLGVSRQAVFVWLRRAAERRNRPGQRRGSARKFG